jgi:hypothetical protein
MMTEILGRLRQLFQTLASQRHQSDHADRAKMAAIFTNIYQQNAWGNPESVSGPGSTLARASDFLDELVALLTALPTRVLLDAPCGDFHWAAPMADAVEQYIGLDVVPALIAHLQQVNRHPNRRFICSDLTRDVLPPADVILCRDCLVHLSFRDIAAALANFQRSGARYLLTTTFIDREANGDIPTGAWRPLNLQAAPFHFPPPIALVDEKCLHSGGQCRDKRLALWAVATLPAPRLDG